MLLAQGRCAFLPLRDFLVFESSPAFAVTPSWVAMRRWRPIAPTTFRRHRVVLSALLRQRTANAGARLTGAPPAVRKRQWVRDMRRNRFTTGMLRSRMPIVRHPQGFRTGSRSVMLPYLQCATDPPDAPRHP